MSASESPMAPSVAPERHLLEGSMSVGLTGWRRVLVDTMKLRRMRIGCGLIALVVAIAVFGPWASPHSATAFLARPFSPPSGAAPLGTDTLGRDVLSRFLDGGRSILAVSALATMLGVTLGAMLGLIAAYGNTRTDEGLMRGLDVVMSFPEIVLPLLFIAMLGDKWWLVVLTVAGAHAPRVARVVRSAALEVRHRDFVGYAAAIGETRWHILRAELLPNVTAPLMVEFGLRLTYSIALVSGLAYLGFGANPPAANWGLMVNENQLGLAQNVWAVAVPVLAIACLTIGVNLVTDAVSRVTVGLDRVVELE